MYAVETGEDLDLAVDRWGVKRMVGETDEELRERCRQKMNSLVGVPFQTLKMPDYGLDMRAFMSGPGKRKVYDDIVMASEHMMKAVAVPRAMLGNEPKPEPFQHRLARVFGLAPDAPDDVLLATAEKVWGGFEEYAQACTRHAADLQEGVEMERKTRVLCADACGVLADENRRLKARVGELLLALEDTKR